MTDHSALLPPYRQVAAILRADIASGKYPPHERLPSAVTLHQEYGVAVFTARKALKVLVDEGLAYRKEGMGTYVAGPA